MVGNSEVAGVRGDDIANESSTISGWGTPRDDAVTYARLDWETRPSFCGGPVNGRRFHPSAVQLLQLLQIPEESEVELVLQL